MKVSLQKFHQLVLLKDATELSSVLCQHFVEADDFFCRTLRDSVNFIDNNYKVIVILVGAKENFTALGQVVNPRKLMSLSFEQDLNSRKAFTDRKFGQNRK